MSKFTQSAFSLLNEAQSMLLDGVVQEGMQHLVLGLKQIKQHTDPAEWDEFSRNTILTHPIASLIHQDPFTYHSYSKPRGYAGDAELLDYIYGIKLTAHNTTSLGQEIFRYTTNAPAPQSVRARKEFLTALIEDVSIATVPPKILSVACGHLRELEDCSSFIQGRVARFVALDQDAKSLQMVTATKYQKATEPVQGSVRSLLTGQQKFENLDLVYAAGLYDYLTLPVAIRLTQVMFQMLSPGGRLLVANFAPNLVDIGYMETFMQWKLIYRNQSEMEQIVQKIPADRIENSRLFWDEYTNIIFLEIIKK